MTFATLLKLLKKYKFRYHKGFLEYNQSIRDSRYKLCPVCFVYYKTTGKKYDNDNVRIAAKKIGMSHHLLKKVANAADTINLYPHARRAILKTIGEPMKLTDKLAMMIPATCRQNGSFDPEEALGSIEEMLTPSEAKTTKAFLGWVSENDDRKFGTANIRERFRQFAKETKVKK